MSEFRKVKRLTIDLNNKSDRRALADKMCGILNVDVLPNVSEIDLQDFCVKHRLAFEGFPDGDIFKFKVSIEEKPIEVTSEDLVKKPQVIKPNKKIKESQKDLDKMQELRPSADDLKAQRVKKLENANKPKEEEIEEEDPFA